MAQPTVQRQRIQRIWATAAPNPDNVELLEGVFVIYAHIYMRKAKRIYIGNYHSHQIPLNINDLVGMTVADASQLIWHQKFKYHQMMKLLKGE